MVRDLASSLARTHTMENLTNPLLPPDLMLEIFLLLPLESILSCKLVSKEWNKLVKHPTFTKLYHNKSTTFFLTGNTLNCLFRPDNDDNTSYKVRRVPIDLTQHRRRNVLGFYHERHVLLPESSNKIACVREEGNFLLYNLFTGDSHVVADAPLRNSAPRYWLCYGFGYDRYEDDYKIVVVCDSICFRYFMDLQESEYNTKTSLIFVYSYGNRGWKSLDGFPHDAYYWRVDRAQAAYSFKDVLVWVVRKRKLHGLEKEKVVVALDIHSYGLVEIRLPPLYYDDHSNMKPLYEILTELDGNLCYSYGEHTIFHMWVMTEYGVPESWTKLFSISTSRINGPLYGAALYQCRDHASNVVVFLCYEYSMELFRYDIDKDEIQVFSRQKGKTRVMLKRLRAKFKKAWCFLGDLQESSLLRC